nr:hypothetical protein [Corynebacterium lactis]
MSLLDRTDKLARTHGKSPVGHRLKEVGEKGRRADGWKSDALAVFADVVTSVSGLMTIFKGFDFSGLVGTFADSAKCCCDEAANKCLEQDEKARESGHSTNECAQKIDEVLEDCELRIEEMARNYEELLAKCEALSEDSEVGEQAAEIATDAANNLVDCSAGMYQERNTCIERCLDQACEDVEGGIVAPPPTAPQPAVSGATQAACASPAVPESPAVQASPSVGPIATSASTVPASVELGAQLMVGVAGIGGAVVGEISTALINTALINMEMPEPCGPEPEPEPCVPEPAPEPPPPAEKLAHMQEQASQTPAAESAVVAEQPQPEPQPQEPTSQAEADQSIELHIPTEHADVGMINAPSAGEW